MSTNETIKDGPKDSTANVQNAQTTRTWEASIPDKQAADKFPKWDILPPYQFINPRIRKTE